jgi:hypothetical protein
MKKIEMIVERTNTGYSAYAKEYPAGTTGCNLHELTANMLEVMNFYFDEIENKSKAITEKDLKITLDLPQFFEFYKVINAKALSERIGMNQSLLSQYISGIKKPSSAQTRRILQGVQKVGRELAEINFLL